MSEGAAIRKFYEAKASAPHPWAWDSPGPMAEIWRIHARKEARADDERERVVIDQLIDHGRAEVKR